MKLRKLFCIAGVALAAFASSPASAVVVTGFSSAAGNTYADFSADGLVSFDLDLVNPVPSATTFNFEIERGDLGGPLLFNAVVNNLFGSGISRFVLTLSNATFDFIGSVNAPFGPGASASGSGSSATISFPTPDAFGFEIGDPLAAGLPQQNWRIDISNLEVGDSFSLRLQVPEPGSLALLLGALAAAGFAHRRTANRHRHMV
jgi:hypothetical protein